MQDALAYQGARHAALKHLPDVSIRQHTSAHVSIRQHTYALAYQGARHAALKHANTFLRAYEAL